MVDYLLVEDYLLGVLPPGGGLPGGGLPPGGGIPPGGLPPGGLGGPGGAGGLGARGDNFACNISSSLPHPLTPLLKNRSQSFCTRKSRLQSSH